MSNKTPSGLSGLSQAFEKLRADYDMSRDTRFVRRRTGLAPQGGSADFHYRTEHFYYNDIEKARDFDRNDSIIGQTISRAVINTIQEGFTLDPRTGDTGLDTHLRDRWLSWASDPDQCDIQGEFSFHDFEVHALRSMLIDGDIVFLALDTGQLQAIEGHSIRTNSTIDNTVLGVTLDDYRRRLQYWIATDPIDPHRVPQSELSSPVDVRDPSGRRQLFHLFDPKRMTQTRGVTALAPIFNVAGMREDIDFAMLVQRQVASCFAIFRKQTAGAGNPPHSPGGYSDSETETSPNGGIRYIENVAPGMEIIGMPGEELQGFSPDIPGQGYEFQLRTMLQTIGVNLGMPLVMVLLDASETNFSGFRGAVEEARKGFRANQRVMIQRLHRPIYHWKLSQWIAEDPTLSRLANRADILIDSHKWNVPGYSYIEPTKDAQGDALRLSNSLTSPRRLHAERGIEWAELHEEIISDNAAAIQAAQRAAASLNELAAASGSPIRQPVHWRELISLPMPAGVQMSMSDPNQDLGPAGSSEEAPTGDMRDLSRRQWQNNRKAINDVLDQLLAEEISEQRARAELSSLGLASSSIDLLLSDILDASEDQEEGDSDDSEDDQELPGSTDLY